MWSELTTGDDDSLYTLVLFLSVLLSLFNFSKLVNANYLINEASYQNVNVAHVLIRFHSENIKNKAILMMHGKSPPSELNLEKIKSNNSFKFF